MELTAVNDAAFLLQDNRRTLVCAATAGEPDTFYWSLEDTAGLFQSAGWTFLVDSPGPSSASWALRCGTGTILASVSEDTRVEVNRARLIARPVAAIVPGLNP